MTIPTSGPVGMNHVNAEIGAYGTPISLQWVRDNTVFNYKDFASILGYSYYQAVSSMNSISRSPSSTVTNCGGVVNCGGLQCSTYGQCGYGHGVYLQANCNCNCTYYALYDCNCECACCDACSCFPAGTFVTMADGSYKPIEQIKVGDKLRGLSRDNVVTGIELPVLGDRRLMSMYDGSLMWSEEHPLWVRRDGVQWWWTAGLDKWLHEIEIGHIVGLRDNSSIFVWDGRPEEFAHETGWRKQRVVYVDGAMSHPDLQLYFIKTDGDRTLFVNGYITTAGTDEFAVDYGKLKW